MYGFAEKWFVDILGDIEYEPYTLNDGSEAVILDRGNFNLVTNVITAMWKEDNDIEDLRPVEIDCDIPGTKILIHKYFANDNILNGLTGGEVKSSHKYISIMTLNRPRFNTDSLIRRSGVIYNNIKNNINTEVQDQDNAEVGESYDVLVQHTSGAEESYDIPPVPPPQYPLDVEENTGERIASESLQDINKVLNNASIIQTHHTIDVEDKKNPFDIVIESDLTKDIVEPKCKLEKTLTEEEEFFDHIKKSFSGSIFSKSRTTINGKLICLFEYSFLEEMNDIIKMEELNDLSDHLGKNIIVMNNYDKRTFLEKIKKKFTLSDIQKHTLIILMNPQIESAFGSNGSRSKQICFGNRVHNLNGLKNTVTDLSLRSINEDESLSEQEKKDRINKIENTPGLNMFSKYDYVFRDTKTNVIWCLKDRCFMYMMFPYYDGLNDKLYKRCLKELKRRFNGDISLSELKTIDNEYHAEVSKENKNEFVNFVVDSSMVFVKEMKDNYNTQKGLYEDFLSKTLEHGKLMDKYLTQIKNFNEEEFHKKEKEKAISSFEETENIPGVLSINIEGGYVNVYTKNIYAQDERTDKWHDIGTFHIKIGMHNNNYDKDNTVKVFNTKHQIDALEPNMQAPHVFNSGSICHGTLVQRMTKAYSERNLYELVYSLILFLQDANTDDSAGERINKWPEVPTEFAEKALNFYDDEEVEEKPTESEMAFDDMLAEAIPIKI